MSAPSFYSRANRPAFFMFGQTEITVPAWHKHHVISKVFSLDLGLLEHNNVGLEEFEHSLGLS